MVKNKNNRNYYRPKQQTQRKQKPPGAKKNEPKKEKKPQKKEKNVPKKLISDTDLGKPVVINRFVSAQGVEDTVLIRPTLDITAFTAAFSALISAGLAKGWRDVKPIYWAYLAIRQDLRNIMTGQKSEVSARLRYLSDIFGSFLPKSRKFRNGQGQIAYSWEHAEIPDVEAKITVRTYSSYMYDLAVSGTSGAWFLQAAPAAYTDIQETYEALSILFGLLASNDSNCMQYWQGSQPTRFLLNDVSAYACSMVSWGLGSSTTGGPYSHVVSEVPIRSHILATFCTDDGSRAPKSIDASAGDSTCSLGYGLLPGFKRQWYKTVYPPIIKFLDIHEVYTWIVYWYTDLVKQAQAELKGSTPVLTGTTVFTQFPYTARQFAIAVRQTVLQIFMESQSLVQFMSPVESTNGFEALRVGSNAYGHNMKQKMRMPCILVENLVRLMFSAYEIETKYKSKKNVQLYIPCWGAFTSFVEPNPTMPILSGGTFSTGNMFPATVATDPNIIDGTGSGGVCNLNSPRVAEVIQEFNTRIEFLQRYSVPQMPLGSAARSGSLLRFTRYSEIRTIAFSEEPTTFRSEMDYEIKKTFVRKDSKAKGKDILLPSGAGLSTSFTTAISSVRKITETDKLATDYFILPILPLDNNAPPNPPSPVQYRSAMNETHLAYVNTETQSSSDTRLASLVSIAKMCAPGLGGKTNDEMVNMIRRISANNEGSYLGDTLNELLGKGIDLTTSAMGDYMKGIVGEIIPELEHVLDGKNGEA